MISIVVKKGLACIVAHFLSQVPNGSIFISTFGALGFLVRREAPEFFSSSYYFSCRESPLYPCCLLRNHGPFFRFFLTKMVIRSPGMILMGRYPLSFLPDTIGTPGSKNDVLLSDHRDSLSSYCESFFYFFIAHPIILVQTRGAWLFSSGS